MRLVATDLDGTLLRGDGSVSDRTVRALARVQETGRVIVLVTGRPPHTLRRAAHAAGLSGLAICSNGAVVYDLDRDEVIRHTPVGADAARRLVRALRATMPGICFAFIREATFSCEPAYRDIASEADHARGFLAEAIFGDALALCDQQPTKMIARHPDLGADTLLTHVRGLGLEGFEATHSGPPFVEIAAAGVTKAWALEARCVDLNIGPDEVIAFGDAPNDVPMLRWAGRGVAVANAHPAVLAVANDVAPSNEEDGVAVVLEQLLIEHRR